MKIKRRDFKKFLKNILRDLDEAGFAVSELTIDHFGIRTNSQEEYELLKKYFAEKIGIFQKENIVRERPVGIFDFRKPIRFRKWQVDMFELLGPSGHASYSNGLEHLEIIISDVDKFFEDNKDIFAKLDKKMVDDHGHLKIYLNLPTGRIKFTDISLREM